MVTQGKIVKMHKSSDLWVGSIPTLPNTNDIDNIISCGETAYRYLIAHKFEMKLGEMLWCYSLYN